MSKKFKINIINSLLLLCLLSPLSAISQGLGGPPDPGGGAGFGDDVNDEIPINSFILLSLIAGGIYGIRKINQKEE